MFDPEAFGAAMADLIEEAVAPLQRRIGELEAELAKPVDMSAQVEHAVAAAVAALPAPKDGKDAEPVDVDSLVKMVLARVPAPANGKDGEDGRNGFSVTLEDVQPMLDNAIKQIGQQAENAVAKAISAIPKPMDGRDGTNGKDGERGEKGADGLGVAGAMIDRDGALQITLTNGEVKSLGVVVGKDGQNGCDGISFEAFEIEYLPESHEMVVKATAAGRTKELRYPAGGIRPAGYWRDGTKAEAGEAWVHDGSLWIARSPTATKPESRCEDWIIAARKGRDGERGAKGADGVPPAPIKLRD